MTKKNKQDDFFGTFLFLAAAAMVFIWATSDKMAQRAIDKAVQNSMKQTQK